MTRNLFKSILPAASRMLAVGFIFATLITSCSKNGDIDAKNITIAENGQTTWTIAYDKLKGNAAEFIEAFTSYTKCSPQTYLETSQQNAQEILIGQTTRPETLEVLKGIKNGFKIAFQGKNW